MKIGTFKTGFFTDNDVDVPEGMICCELSYPDGPLTRVRTVKGDLSVFHNQICFLKDHPETTVFKIVIEEYFKSRSTPAGNHCKTCRYNLKKALKETSQIDDKITQEITAALELLDYYEAHQNGWPGYTKGEVFFLCHIGKAILALVYEKHTTVRVVGAATSRRRRKTNYIGHTDEPPAKAVVPSVVAIVTDALTTLISVFCRKRGFRIPEANQVGST